MNLHLISQMKRYLPCWAFLHTRRCAKAKKWN